MRIRKSACCFWILLQVLTGSHMAKVLLMVHQQLALARHFSHLLRSLGPLRAALQLLGERIRVPLTFRYVVHILLWLLKARYLQLLAAFSFDGHARWRALWN